MKIRGELIILLFIALITACDSQQTSASSESNQQIEGTTEGSQAENLGKARLEFTIEGLKGGMCYLGGVYGNQNFIADSAKADNQGNIIIERDSPYNAGLYFLVLPDRKTIFQFLLDKDQEFKMSTRLNSLVSSMNVEGSLDNQLFYENQKYEQKYQASYDSITAKMKNYQKGSMDYNTLESRQYALIEQREKHIQSFKEKYPDSFFTQFKIAGQNPKLKNWLPEDKQVYIYRKEFWDNVDFDDERLLRTPVFHNKLQRFIKELTPQNGDSIVKYADWITNQVIDNKELFKYTANWIAIEYKEAAIMDWEKVYYHMIKNFFTQDLAYWSDSIEVYRLQEQIKSMKYSQLGMKGKNLKCKNEKGEMIDMFGLGAKYTVLFMWTTECDNCKKEWPELIKVHRNWKPKGLEVFALCIDKDENTWKNYISKYDESWHNVIDPDIKSLYGNYYHVDHTPEIYLMDENHKIIGKNIKAFQIPEIIKENK